jgi:hypothetical protein
LFQDEFLLICRATLKHFFFIQASRLTNLENPKIANRYFWKAQRDSLRGVAKIRRKCAHTSNK